MYAKESVLYMQPLIQQLRDQGTPLTAKPLGFQRLNGWTRGYQSLRLLLQLLHVDLCTELGKFTTECMPPAFGVYCLYPLPFVTTTILSYTAFLGAVYPIFIGSPSTPSSPIPSAHQPR